IKFNCDASWQKESGRAGLGFVARNARGDVLLSGARTQCYASSSLEAEAKSLLWRQINHIIKVIPREGNEVAHSIATNALGCSDELLLE
nr:reverse transcriptase [Tanacetum cinerariifolium]